METTTIENMQLSTDNDLLKNSVDIQLLGSTFELGNDLLLPSRSNSPLDNEIDSLPQACIMRTLKIVSNALELKLTC